MGGGCEERPPPRSIRVVKRRMAMQKVITVCSIGICAGVWITFLHLMGAF